MSVAGATNKTKSKIGNQKPQIFYGGEGGIRTHGTVPRSQHFQCCQFNHSCTSPEIADFRLPIVDCVLRPTETMCARSIGNHQLAIGNVMAERVGFEPTVGVNPLRFSRPVHY